MIPSVNNHQYYAELKSTYKTDALLQLMHTIEDYSEEFPAEPEDRKAYVVFINQARPGARTKLQELKG